MKRISRWTWSTRRRKVGSALAALTLVGASVAVAAWLITVGAGPTNGKFGQLQGPSFNAVSVFPSNGDGLCFPGGSCAGAVNVTNPNAVALKITAVTAGSFTTGIVVTGGGPGCTAGHVSSNVSVAAQTFATPINVPVGSGNVIIPNLFSAASGLHSDCQNATFEIPANQWGPFPSFTFSTG